MKTRIPKRVYTAQYREAAVRQVIDAGRSAAEVARSLEMSEKTLANWVRQVRRGLAPVKRAADLQVSDAQAELARLRAEDCEIVRPVRHEPYGPVCVFRDPWGNLWDLIGPTDH